MWLYEDYYASTLYNHFLTTNWKVKTDLGSTWRRHVDQIKPSKIAEDIAQNTPLIEEPSVETTENTICKFTAHKSQIKT
jgi:hypothetical protein